MKIELKPDVAGDLKKFDLLYKGFIIGGSMTQQKGMIIMRRELQILGKLEAISKESSPPVKFFGDEVTRDLTGGTMDLSQQESEMLTTYVSNVPWNTGKPVRDALDLLDWLASL